MRRALIIGPGGLRGAYSGGVVSTLCRVLGRGYFQKVYGCSAGAYTGSYAVSGQPDQIESIWRECVHSNLLVDFSRVFGGKRPILDLFYLNDVLRSERYHLSMNDLLISATALEIVATDEATGQPHYFYPQSEESFFLQVRASAAVPLFHPKVNIGGQTYFDGGLSDPIPLEKALGSGFHEIIVVCNRPLNDIGLLAKVFLKTYAVFATQINILHVQKRIGMAAKLVDTHGQRIHVISPSQEPLHKWQFDSNPNTLNQLVDLGIKDALNFIATKK